MAALPHGYDYLAVRRMAWKAARMHPTGVLRLPERADVAELAIIGRLYEPGDEPTRHDLFNTAVGAISVAAARELREHGYSTKTGRPMHGYAAWWQAPKPARDALEERIIERIAVHQIMAALPPYQRRALEALAAHGSYATAADAIGCTYNTMRRYLHLARQEFMTHWCYPDPPARHWGQDKPGHRTPRQAMTAIRDRQRRRGVTVADRPQSPPPV